MCRKFIFLILLIPCFLVQPVFATAFDGQESLDSLYEAAPESITDQFTELSMDSLTESFSLSSVIDFLTSEFLSALKDNIAMMISVIGVLLLMGIYDTLRDSFAAKGTQTIADFFCAATIALILCPPLMDRATELGNVICELSDYMNLSLPVLSGLLTASGHVGSASILHFFIYQAAA